MDGAESRMQTKYSIQLGDYVLAEAKVVLRRVPEFAKE
jgi:hypothetical protein